MEIEPDLSICTVAGSDANSLRRLLRSIEDTADPIAIEIVVAEVEPGSIAGIADEVPGLLVIHIPGLSRVAAINQALRNSRGRYTAWLDPEVVLLPECLKRLIDFMDENPDTGLITPRIVDTHGKEEPSIRKFPGLFAMLLGSYPLDHGVHPGTTSEVDWSNSGFHLLRRECLEEIGLLDETLPVCAELELYRQALRQGWHSIYLAEAVAVHPHHARHQRPLRPGFIEQIRCLKKRWLA